MKKKPFFISYLVVGLGSVLFAFAVATRFLGVSFSQEAGPGKRKPDPVKNAVGSNMKFGGSDKATAKALEKGIKVLQESSPDKVDDLPVAGKLKRNGEQSIPTELEVNNSGQIPKESPEVLDAEESFRVTFFPPYIIDVEILRDPFEPYSQIVVALEEGGHEFPVMKLQEFSLTDLELMGIIWNVSEPKAMFKDPESNVHIVGRDDRIGRKNGYIAVIREGEVVVVEPRRVGSELIYSTRIVRLKR